MKHLIHSQQVSKEFLQRIFSRADLLRKKSRSRLKGKILTSLFYESSTRTRLSFESAMLRLGGQVMGTESASHFSSVSKGESLEDTVRVVGRYCDVIVLRSSKEGDAVRASRVSSVPIINAGDGKGQHPTQAMLDLYTIQKEVGRLDNLKVVMVGDLKAGRTVHSLCYLLGKFKNIRIVFVSPKELRVPQGIKDYLTQRGVVFSEEEDLESHLPFADIVYMTRIQKERLSKQEYKDAKGRFVINKENLRLLRPSARILHPLPHVEEIDLPLTVEREDRRIAYFRQAENGLYVRMALLETLLR